MAEFLDEAYPGRQLRADDPYQRAKDKIFIESIIPYINVYGEVLFFDPSKRDINVFWEDIKERLTKAEHILQERMSGEYKYVSGI